MLLTHKQALFEIFTSEMEVGGSLEESSDIVLKTAGEALPKDVFNFITLGDFTITDIRTGSLKDKYLVIFQEIICASVVKSKEEEANAEAESRAYELSRLVRTILKGNKTLVSDSYPEGAAKATVISDSPLETVIYSDSPTVIVTILLEIKRKESD